ncbi:MAG: ATPase, T2SS/T4P/T4SS family [Maricaulaceae bacterium]|jgi:general secretion pathway protein E
MTTAATVPAKLPYAFAREHRLALVWIKGTPECICLGASSLEAMLEVQRVAGELLTFREVEPAAFDQVLEETYSDAASQAAEMAAADDDLAALADDAAAVDDLLDSSDDAPVVRLINALLLEAVKANASDVHIETLEKRLVVRFRIDGVLQERLEPAHALAPLLVSRIKVMARLDIAEKRRPQDGRVTVRVGGHELDVRISTIPSQHGERVVLRLLNRSAARLDVASLGMSARGRETFEQLLRRPSGLLLVTGPTGSGKTTTLYAALTRLNDRKRNILTIEDPIEYAVEGVGQTQVNPKTDYTFAAGLRAILRQDPDVIMVGEIRDRETASAAIQAGMTGHFVLSTLHTNTAVGAITRLADMGVERFLIAPNLTGVLAQRLVRALCPRCRTPAEATEADANLLDGALAPGTKIFRPTGCEACGGQGYRGRTGLYEVVALDDELRALIHDGASEAAKSGQACLRTAQRRSPRASRRSPRSSARRVTRKRGRGRWRHFSILRWTRRGGRRRASSKRTPKPARARRCAGAHCCRSSSSARRRRPNLTGRRTGLHRPRRGFSTGSARRLASAPWPSRRGSSRRS